MIAFTMTLKLFSKASLGVAIVKVWQGEELAHMICMNMLIDHNRKTVQLRSIIINKVMTGMCVQVNISKY